RSDATAWIEEVICNLEMFKRLVDDGLVAVMDGEYSAISRAPSQDKAGDACITLSIDYVKLNPKN
ncbi:hypothetical protein ACXWOP_09875, partial [Streptococcus pyogenes]